MLIEFSSSGGVANRELNYRVDTATMPPDQADTLEQLVKSSGVFDIEKSDLNPDVSIGRADVISYHLIVSDDTRHTDLWLNDISAPAIVRPLLERLQELARHPKGR